MKPIKISLATNLITWAALVLLTLASCGLSLLRLGPLTLPIALLIATLQAALIAGVYMHGFYASTLVKVSIAAAVIWQAIMVFLTMTDYATRGWLLPSGK